MDNEQRKNPRIKMNRTLGVARDGESVLGKLVDLSIGGVCFISSIEFVMDAKMSLTCVAGEDKEGVKLDAKVLRSLPVGHSSYQTAAVFLNPDMAFLENLLKSSQTV